MIEQQPLGKVQEPIITALCGDTRGLLESEMIITGLDCFVQNDVCMLADAPRNNSVIFKGEMEEEP